MGVIMEQNLDLTQGKILSPLLRFALPVPLAFMQSMSAFMAQNRGAGRLDRAVAALKYAIGVSVIFSVQIKPP